MFWRKSIFWKVCLLHCAFGGRLIIVRLVVTQVFPDEFHLHTLDQFLSAVARLNPHVNVKAIVVGLMDRLSAYAQRESETESPEQRKKTEEESIANLLEQLKIAKETKKTEPTSPTGQQNGDASEEAQPDTEAESSASSITAVSAAETETGTEIETTETSGEVEKSRGIPKNIKLFEIFHEQVATLVKMQRLTIQDTIGLLVSLANLAL
jgi:vacuolar protein sorting-associated protein 35